MLHHRLRRTRTLIAFAAFSAVAPLAHAATPSVLWDLRVHDTGGKSATVTEIGQAVVLDLYCTCYGQNANPNDDRIQGGSGYLFSSTGGLLGDLLADFPTAPFNQAGAAAGVQVDRDRDGDLDVGDGGNPVFDTTFYAFRASPVPTVQPAGGFFVGSITFIPAAPTASSTEINFTLRSLLTWPDNTTTQSYQRYSDGTGTLGVNYGAPVVITGNPPPPSGGITYLSGTKPVHVTIDSHMSAAAGGTLTFQRGLDVISGGTLDASANATIALEVNDLTSGNAGGTLLLNSTSIATADNGTFTQSAGFTRLGATRIGTDGGGNATLSITGGNLEAGATLLGGASTPASLAQSGGGATLASLDLLDGGGATLAAGDLRVIGDTRVGVGVAATFTQAGGKSAFNTLMLGARSGPALGTGTYVMQGGNLTAALTYLGTYNGDGVGHFQQSGGTSFLGGLFLTSPVGPANPSTVEISGNATAEAAFLSIGQAPPVESNASGVLRISGGGKLIVDGGARIAACTTGLARLEITGGSFSAGYARLGDQYIDRGIIITNYPGVMQQTGGAVDIGQFALRPNGLYQISGGTVRFGQSVSNSISYESGGGTIDFTNAAIPVTFGNNCFADFSQIQLLNASNVTFIGGPGSLLNFRAGSDPLTQIGSIQTQGLVHVAGSPLTIPAGKSVGGSGTIEGNVTNNGVVAPGNSPGVINVSGDYAQASTAALAMEIAGATSDKFDQLTITGSATLAGSLNLSLLDGFVPQPGDQFPIVAASSLSGTFANAPSQINVAGAGTFDVLYTSSGVMLTNFQAVPEPAGAMTLLAMGGLLVRRARRCRQPACV